MFSLNVIILNKFIFTKVYFYRKCPTVFTVPGSLDEKGGNTYQIESSSPFFGLTIQSLVFSIYPFMLVFFSICFAFSMVSISFSATVSNSSRCGPANGGHVVTS
jgi:hypothetical protein